MQQWLEPRVLTSYLHTDILVLTPTQGWGHVELLGGGKKRRKPIFLRELAWPSPFHTGLWRVHLTSTPGPCGPGPPVKTVDTESVCLACLLEEFLNLQGLQRRRQRSHVSCAFGYELQIVAVPRSLVNRKHSQDACHDCTPQATAELWILWGHY